MTGPEALTITEVATYLSDALGKKVRYVDVDPAENENGDPQCGNSSCLR